MRTTPYNFASQPAQPAAPAKETTVTQPSFDSSVIRDLSKELARPVSKPTPQPQNEAETTTQTPPPGTDNAAETTEPTKGTANLDEGVKKFKEEIEGDIKKAIEDPKRASKNVLKFINMGRFILYPWIYKRAIFEGPELTAIDTVLKKVADAKRASKEPEFDPFEKGVYAKWEEYEKRKQGILWTAEEIDQINEVAYLKLAEIQFLRWLMQNEWAIVIIYIESKRFVPLFAYRMGFGSVDMNVL